MRIHRPDDGPNAALLLVHGGGWVWGGIDEVDALARTLSVEGGFAVGSVAYRRAPEHRYPAALDDVDAATRWLSAHGADHGIDPRRLAALGRSAGGNLVAALALRHRDRGSS